MQNTPTEVPEQQSPLPPPSSSLPPVALEPAAPTLQAAPIALVSSPLEQPELDSPPQEAIYYNETGMLDPCDEERGADEETQASPLPPAAPAASTASAAWLTLSTKAPASWLEEL